VREYVFILYIVDQGKCLLQRGFEMFTRDNGALPSTQLNFKTDKDRKLFQENFTTKMALLGEINSTLLNTYITENTNHESLMWKYLNPYS
jgi:hypothetical protein